VFAESLYICTPFLGNQQNIVVMNLLELIESQVVTKSSHPSFKAGDTVTIHYKIKEGDKERVQLFTGVVLQRRGHDAVHSFTVRKMSNGVGVERIFPIHSPFIEKIEVKKRGVVRRARIFYLRNLTGKKARIAEKIQVSESAG
jgi:large subunit ribosomal protein L19